MIQAVIEVQWCRADLRDIYHGPTITTAGSGWG